LYNDLFIGLGSIHMGKANIYHDTIQDLVILFKAQGSLLRYFKKDDSIYLDYIASIGAGSGTRAMRCLVNMSIDSGFDGKITLQACYSSHLFHLLMGMVPEERGIDYVKYYYGFMGPEALKELRNNNKLDSCSLNKLKEILSKEKNIPEQQITLKQILENRDFLLSLQEKKLSYIQNKFIPELLDILETSKDNKRPDTSYLTDIPMVLSEEGKKRWKNAIALNEEFEPFRDFAHLRPLMTQQQIKKLDKIFLRDTAVGHNMASVSSEHDQVKEDSKQVQHVAQTSQNKSIQKKGKCTRYTFFASAAILGVAVVSSCITSL
jgi:hypothetical protein